MDMLVFSDMVQTFFTEYRVPINHIMFHEAQDSRTDDKGKKVRKVLHMSEETWKENPSTKWTMLVRLLKRLLATDDESFFPRWVKTGEGDSDEGYEEYRDDEFVPEEHSGDSKIMIYVEFTKTIEALRDVSSVLTFSVSCLKLS